MPLSRRRLLKSAAATAAFTIVPRRVLGGPNHVPPSETVNIALIGAGGQGRTNLRRLFKETDARVIAVADPAEYWNLEPFYFKGEAGRGPISAEIEKEYQPKDPAFHCRQFEDFRVMLEREKGIDAVLIATPDHQHAYVSVRCMKAGKHTYCEKPLTHNIAEARYVAAVAKETGVATQMGNIGHSTEGIRQTCEWIWDGAIGNVTRMAAWVPGSRWNKTLMGKPTEAQSVPQGFNWDLWLGPREPRPYNSAYAPVSWRDFWQFGCGVLGDFGCHDLDSATWAFNLRAPATIEAFPAGVTNSEIAPHGELVYFHFEKDGDQQPLDITWYAGGLKPATPPEMGPDAKLNDRAVLFYGDKGIILCGGAGGPPRLFPESLDQSYKRPDKKLPRSKGHHRDWIDAIKGGSQPSANFEHGARLTEITLLGVAALRTRKKLHWDPTTMKAQGVPDADAVFHETYRKGWEVM
jgi:predicted dehydrogenase